MSEVSHLLAKPGVPESDFVVTTIEGCRTGGKCLPPLFFQQQVWAEHPSGGLCSVHVMIGEGEETCTSISSDCVAFLRLHVHVCVYIACGVTEDLIYVSIHIYTSS